MKSRAICLSVSKWNERYVDLLDEYADEFNMPRAQAVFKILKEYNTYRINEVLSKWEALPPVL